MPGRVRRRKAPAVRRQDVPTEAQARQARDTAITRERLARLFGGSHQLDDATLADLRTEQRADDEAERQARIAEHG